MWIKICGIRDAETAAAVAALAPDAIGLNFYADSPRCVAPDVAAEIVRRLPENVAAVGVFVNHATEEVRAICRRTGITIVQLHGDEPPEQIAELSEFEVIRAVRVREGSRRELAAHLHSLPAQHRPLACLVDAHVRGAYGGTGESPPWGLLADAWDRNHWPPLILAGGLTPRNIADAVRLVRPWGVDVASGVESAGGVKDLALVGQFIESARRAAPSV